MAYLFDKGGSGKGVRLGTPGVHWFDDLRSRLSEIVNRCGYADLFAYSDILSYSDANFKNDVFLINLNIMFRA